jgi:tetrapyrrole methylase family protein/MazG family protein
LSPRITVCGLGPGRPDGLTGATRSAIERSRVRFLRTAVHPTAGAVGRATSFDHLYHQAGSFPEVYQAIVEALVAAATEGPDEPGAVLYAVPGSPLVLEESVRRLRDDPRVEVDLLPAVSFLDEVWARLGVDPVDDGVRLVDGYRFAVQAAGERGPLLVAHAHAPWVLSDIKLALEAGPEQPVIVLQRLGTADEQVFEVAWPDLDRVVEPDHLTTLYLPEVAVPVANELARTVELVARLRRDCPWDRSQTHHSLRRYLLEEAYEVLEAIDQLPAGPDTMGAGSDGDGGLGGGGPGSGPVEVDLGSDGAWELLEEELGDLWFQVLFHSRLAAEAGRFTVADVARTLHDKLVSRHPHVFGSLQVADAADVVANWEQIKQREKRRSSALDGIPPALPALSYADKVLNRAARAGWPAELGSLGPELERLAGGVSSDDLGRLLLGLVAVARARDLDAEGALRAAVATAEARFRAGEAQGSPGADWAFG